MMNLAPSPAHRGLGMPAPGALSMAGFAAAAATSPFSASMHHHHHHQRSPFGIQELPGLSQHAVSMAQEHSRGAALAMPAVPTVPVPTVPVSHDSVISAVTSYIPRSLCTPTAPVQAPMLADPCAPHPFSSWRANFMQFAGTHGQSVLSHLTNGSPAANGFSQHGAGAQTDNSSGICFLTLLLEFRRSIPLTFRLYVGS